MDRRGIKYLKVEVETLLKRARGGAAGQGRQRRKLKGDTERKKMKRFYPTGTESLM